MYVYIQTEESLYTVGFYKPSGDWVAESDHPTEGDAANRVHWLNGGNPPPENRPPVAAGVNCKCTPDSTFCPAHGYFNAVTLRTNFPSVGKRS